MNEEEFFKEHPSFIETYDTGQGKFEHLINWDEDDRGWDKEEVLNQIHETQLDKQKVKEVIDEIMDKKREVEGSAFDAHWEIAEELKELKKKLGLEPELFGMKIREDENLKGEEFRLK